MTDIATRLRPAPPLLLGCGLLLWGWQTGFLVYAVPMALLLESPRWTRWRCSIPDRDFNIISDVSGFIFFILVVYIFSNDGAGGIYKILAIMPFILYLLILGQLYGERGTIRLSVLFISLRKLDTDKSMSMNRDIDLSLPYFLLCLVSASAGNRHPFLFFLAVCLLTSIVLWSLRPRRYHPAVWATLLILSLSAAYAGQSGMRQVQRSIELLLMDAFEKYMWRYRDPDRASTAIGSLGRIKLSDRILLRVDTDRELESPLLLHEASYSSYGFGVWSNPAGEFELVDPDLDAQSWTLRQEAGEENLAVSMQFIKEVSVIPLPHDTARLYDVNAFEINRNRYGTIKMETTTGWVKYRVNYGAGGMKASTPNRSDLYVPEHHAGDFNRLVNEWQLDGQKPGEIITSVREAFANDYSYTLENRNRYPRGRYLHNFLFESKQGHCEYFATATVLLLRAAGIPARYAVGYAVSEYSELEDQYVARGHDAHSWALAYVNGSWHVVDTTPSVWIPQTHENASPFEMLFDLTAWLKYRYTLWQSDEDLAEESGNSDYLLWLLPPLLLFLAWRLYYRRRPDKGKPDLPEERPENRDRPGVDSALYRLVDRLEQLGYYRRPGETLACWFQRIGDIRNNDNIMTALQLHYRYRFDPEISDDDTLRSHINRRVDEILAAYSQ